MFYYFTLKTQEQQRTKEIEEIENAYQNNNNKHKMKQVYDEEEDQILYF